MRSSSLTWACALLVIGLQGQLTSAGTTAAHTQTDSSRYRPRVSKRQDWNGTDPLDGLLGGSTSPSPAPQPSTSWTPPSEQEVTDELVHDGKLPEHDTTPIHTKYTLTHTGTLDPQTKTYTLDSTPVQTDSPVTNPSGGLLGGLLLPSPSTQSGQSDSPSVSSPPSNGVLDSGTGGLVAPQTHAPATQTTTAAQSPAAQAPGPSADPIVVGLDTVLGGSASSESGESAPAPTNSGLLGLSPLSGPAPSPSRPHQNNTTSPSSSKPGLLGPVLDGLLPSPNPAPSTTTDNSRAPQTDVPSSTPAPPSGLLGSLLGTGTSPSPSSHNNAGATPGILDPLLGQVTAPSSSNSNSAPAPGMLDPLLGHGTAPSSGQTSSAPAPGILDPLLGHGTAPSSGQTSSAPAPGILGSVLGTVTAPSPTQSTPSPAPGILDPLLGHGTAPSPTQSGTPGPAPGLLSSLVGGGQPPTNSTTTGGGLLGVLPPQQTQPSGQVTISGTGGTYVMPKPGDATGTGFIPQQTNQPHLSPGPMTPGPNATSASSSVATHTPTYLDPSQNPPPASPGTGAPPAPSNFTLTNAVGPDGRTSAHPVPATSTNPGSPAPANATTSAHHPDTQPDATTTAPPAGERTTAPPIASSTSSFTRGPQSILPIGSNSDTALAIPTQIVIAPQTVNEISAGAAPTDKPKPALPTYVPRLIQAPGGIPTVETGYALVQLGFNYSLNFLFVVQTDDATSQIFAYLPKGIAWGLSIPEQNVVMNALMPYDTSATMGYITTLAQAYIPKDMVNTLQLALHAPNSALYNNPDLPVRQLMSMVNPAIPLLPGASLDDGSADDSGAPGLQAAQQASTAGAPIGGDAPTSAPVRGTTVGIGIGAVAGAAVYAAAMVFVARRYRQKRRTRHTRNLSAPTAERGEPRMSEVPGGGLGSLTSAAHGGRLSGFYAFGRHSGSERSSDSGRGSRGSRNSGHSSNARSVREQGISNPIMSENSLGWN